MTLDWHWQIEQLVCWLHIDLNKMVNLLFSLSSNIWVKGIANGNQSFVGLVNPRIDGQNPVNPFSMIFLAIFPYANDRFLSSPLGIAHLPWYPKKWHTELKDSEINVKTTCWVLSFFDQFLKSFLNQIWQKLFCFNLRECQWTIIVSHEHLFSDEVGEFLEP